MPKTSLSFVILCSGRGSNMDAILEAHQRGVINAQPIYVISENSKAEALIKAQDKNIPVKVLDNKNKESRDLSLAKLLEDVKPDFIVLAGYLKKIPDEVINKYNNKILNIHPSLLPEFGGKGMYGLNVHKAVLDSQKKESGLTIHLVNNEYDSGKILHQVKVPVKPDDTPETLAKRILKEEHKSYPLVIENFVQSILKS